MAYTQVVHSHERDLETISDFSDYWALRQEGEEALTNCVRQRSDHNAERDHFGRKEKES